MITGTMRLHRSLGILEQLCLETSEPSMHKTPAENTIQVSQSHCSCHRPIINLFPPEFWSKQDLHESEQCLAAL